MLDRNIFSERLKTVRLKENLTMVDIANFLGISKQSVHEWQTKQSAPSVDKLIALADYFGVSIDYLVGRSDNPEVNLENLMKDDIMTGGKSRP